MLESIVSFIRDLYQEPESFIPLHAPVFFGNEKEYLCNCVDTTFVSSVGEYVDRFEDMVHDYTGAHAVAVVNGTSGLTAALSFVGVGQGDLVLTQGLTFVATPNAIRHAGAEPVFLDSDVDTLGLSPVALRRFLENHEGPLPSACVPVHILGHPCRIEEICSICDEWGIPVVEDAAEGLGSFRGGRHLGTYGRLGVLSFNGNKTITTGGGGMILSNDAELASKAKHLTTTAKLPHPWEFSHDQTAWNYRMPNINAALGCAQMECLEDILQDKRRVAAAYQGFFEGIDGADFMGAPEESVSNYWLNSVAFVSRAQRDAVLEYTNRHGVMTRPLWTLMCDLPMYEGCVADSLENARDLFERIVSLPSGPRGRILR